MNKTLKVWELGYIRRKENEWLVIEAEVFHSRQSVKRETWRVEMRVETIALVRHLMDHYDCDQFHYQAAWTLGRLYTKEYVQARMLLID